MEETKKSEEIISEDVKELVIARLDVLPADKKISIGSSGEFTKSELIERVKKEDEVGRQIIELELTFLRALKEGKLLEEVISAEEE